MSAIKQALKRVFIKLLEKNLEKSLLEPVDVERQDIQRILISCPHYDVEDLLLATPVLRATRQTFPEAKISVITAHDTAPILDNNVYIDEVILFNKRRTIRALLKSFFSKHDLAIVLTTFTHSLTSDLLARLSGAKYILGSEYPVMPHSDRNFLFNLIAPYSEINKHQTERNLDIVRYIEIDTDNLFEEMNLRKSDKMAALHFLQENDVEQDDFILGLHIGGDEDENRWPVNKFVSIAKFFSDKFDAKIIVSCEQSEEALLKEFCGGLPFAPIDISHFNLQEKAAALCYSDLVICNESETMHLAGSVGVPFVALFGSSDPYVWKPIGRQFMALKGGNKTCGSILEEQVIKTAEELVRKFPKSKRFDFKEIDISEQALEKYLETLGELSREE